MSTQLHYNYLQSIQIKFKTVFIRLPSQYSSEYNIKSFYNKSKRLQSYFIAIVVITIGCLIINAVKYAIKLNLNNTTKRYVHLKIIRNIIIVAVYETRKISEEISCLRSLDTRAKGLIYIYTWWDVKYLIYLLSIGKYFWWSYGGYL